MVPKSVGDYVPLFEYIVPADVGAYLQEFLVVSAIGGEGLRVGLRIGKDQVLTGLRPDRFKLPETKVAAGTKIVLEACNLDERSASLVELTLTGYLDPELAPQGASSSPDESTLRNSLVLEKEIARGGFGVVWRGRDALRTVAIKLFHERGEAAIRLALGHAKALAQVDDHANVVRVHYVSTVVDPTSRLPVPCVVTEFIDGPTLGEHLYKLEQSEQLLEMPGARRIGEGLIAGLNHLHSRTTAHGDLHSSNVMLLGGQAKLIDVYSSKSLKRLSTPRRELQFRADISELAALLHELLLATGDETAAGQFGPAAFGGRRTLEEVAQAFSEATSVRSDSSKGSASTGHLGTAKAAAIAEPLWRRVAGLMSAGRMQDLDQLLRESFEAVGAGIEAAGHSQTDEPSLAMVEARLSLYERLTDELVAASAQLGRWGNNEHGKLYTEHFASLAERVALGPKAGRYDKRTVALPWLMLQRLIMGLAIGSLSRDNYQVMFVLLQHRLLSLPGQTSFTIIEHLGYALNELMAYELDPKLIPGRAGERTANSNRQFELLRPLVDPVVSMSPQKWESVYEQSELILALDFYVVSESKWCPPGRYAWKLLHKTGPLATVKKDLEQSGIFWAPLRGGLFRGDVERLKTALADCEAQMSKLGWFV